MATAREQQTFPTRHYPYRRLTAEEAEADAPEPLAAGRLHRFVLGLDEAPRPMNDEELQTLVRDPFAELLLKRGVFPLSLHALLNALDTLNGTADGLPVQKNFLVADGGQIPWTPETANLSRQLRLAIARLRGSEALLLISASTVPDSAVQFLQVLAWDAHNEVYHYYERRLGTWLWAGHSPHALMPPTRGRGPFDSHVNGSLVMKELRAPWNNWHSMSATIQDNVLAPDDPLRHEPLFLNRLSAHELEQFVVRPGIERWNRARLKKARTATGIWPDVRLWLRQVLTTTTVNLTSANQPSQTITDDDTLILPSTFFLNTEALLDLIGLDVPLAPIRVPGRLYRASLRRFDFALVDGDFRQPGDTFFAFLVPEPAFEDTHALALLLQQRLISPRFAACLLMVDFANPIFSAARTELLDFVPEQAHFLPANSATLGSDLETLFVTALETVEATLPLSSAAREFLQHWRLPGDTWQQVLAERLAAYFANLQQQATTQAAFDDWVRLAESRRREFGRRPLKEFDLTLPMTNIPANAPALRMRADGTVQPA